MTLIFLITYFDKLLKQSISKYYEKNYHDFKWFFQIHFQEYFRNISPKAITKVVKKQASVAHVIFFAPLDK
jgi:hypothetical protein